jgi:Flp pilus assembly protein TadG
MPAMLTGPQALARGRNGRCRSGSALVETAIALPICLLFIFGVMEYGRYLMMLHLANNAAREGARYAVSHTQPVVLEGVTYGNSTSDVTNTVDRYLTGKRMVNQVTSVYLSDPSGNNIGTWTNAQSGESICVQIAGQFQWFTPTLLGMPSQTNMQVRAIMRTEAN